MDVFKNMRHRQKQAKEIERTMPPAGERMAAAQARMAGLTPIGQLQRLTLEAVLDWPSPASGRTWRLRNERSSVNLRQRHAAAAGWQVGTPLAGPVSTPGAGAVSNPASRSTEVPRPGSGWSSAWRARVSASRSDHP